jgi:hypothetical protein
MDNIFDYFRDLNDWIYSRTFCTKILCVYLIDVK